MPGLLGSPATTTDSIAFPPDHLTSSRETRMNPLPSGRNWPDAAEDKRASTAKIDSAWRRNMGRMSGLWHTPHGHVKSGPSGTRHADFEMEKAKTNPVASRASEC